MADDPTGPAAAVVRVVIDAGPVIHLSWIHHLHLLRALFEDVVLPIAVRNEVLAAPDGTLGLDLIRETLTRNEWRVLQLPPNDRLEQFRLRLTGAGETEAIELARLFEADLLITDDARARVAAERAGLLVTGTVGVLQAARNRGLIEAALPFVLELRRLGQWVSEELIRDVRVEEENRD
ncbi:MAG: DUF3368 domain-containing protein [Dehalococcoidia bacterium]